MTTMPNRLLAGIDAGGTTFKCGIADASGTLITKHRVPVTTPRETLGACIAYFKDQSARLNAPFDALGIASFGPLEIDPASPDYGTILNTPKAGWAGTNLRAAFAAALNIPVAINTDVNGALIAEMTKGSAHNCTCAAYVTIGTGIGAGVFVNGSFAGLPLHPEFGHIPVRLHPEDQGFTSSCSFHSDCLEGHASAAAFMRRYGDPQALPASHPGWALEADYLAQACRVLTLAFRPERIILGGGLMLAPHLIHLVRRAYERQIAGYLGQSPHAIDSLIVTPGLGDDAGLHGAIMLAKQIVSTI